MAEQSASESSPDRDFDITADMLVNDFDDERTLEEEEAMESSEDAQNELDDLHKEGDMPIEELLSMYGYGDGGGTPVDNTTTRSSSPDEILSSQDLTLGKEDMARHMLDLEVEEVEGVEDGGEEEGEEEMDEDEVMADDGVAAASSAASAKEDGSVGGELLLLDDDVPEDDPSVSTSRLLRCKRSTTANAAVSHHQSESESESSQEDYVLEDDDDFKKARLAVSVDSTLSLVTVTIQVGSDYQAQIPDGLCKYDGAPAYENDDKLLWDPSKILDLDVEDYLRKCQQPLTSCTQGVHTIPSGGHVRDDEQALYMLLQCGHNFEEAMRRRRMQSILPADTMSLWSEEECRSFESGLRTYGKDFHLVQQNKVRTRSVGELVQFYYLWKKTERHDVFANKTRLEKKKYSLHPGTTDYMDRFLDEQENPAAHRDRSSSPNVHSLISGDHKRQHLNNRSPAVGGAEDSTGGRNNNGHHLHHHHHHHHHLQPRIMLDPLPLKSGPDTNGNAEAHLRSSIDGAATNSGALAIARGPVSNSRARRPSTGGDAGIAINNGAEMNHHHLAHHLHHQGGATVAKTLDIENLGSGSGPPSRSLPITPESSISASGKPIIQ